MRRTFRSSVIQQDINHVLCLAQRDCQELFSSIADKKERREALENERVLNSVWSLIEASPSLYYSLKTVLPYLDRHADRRPTDRLKRIVAQANHAIQQAEKGI